MDRPLLLNGAFLLVVLLGVLAYGLIGKLRGPKRAEAEVVDKQLCAYSQLSFGRHGFFNRTGRVALFQVEGRTVGLFCPEELFKDLKKGERGTLFYQGGSVLEFRKMKK